tara:strand:- start:4789 stop:5391 length:603 start_codon:yes stop_codon:yes gene_type:complete
MSYKFRFPGLPEYNADSAGLKFREFNIYPISVPGSEVTPSPNPFGLSASAWTTGNSGVTSSINRDITSSATTFVFRGYFKPDQTANDWQFQTTSNDGSWLWIDGHAEVATTQLTPADAIVKNGGQHSEATVNSSNITLSQSAENDLFYAFAVVAGNDPGNGSIRVRFRRGGGSFQSDGTGFFFHDSRRGDGFYPDSEEGA